MLILTVSKVIFCFLLPRGAGSIHDRQSDKCFELLWDRTVYKK